MRALGHSKYMMMSHGTPSPSLTSLRLFASKYTFDEQEGSKSPPLYSNLSPEDKKLASMTSDAASQIDESQAAAAAEEHSSSRSNLIHQRQTFEEILKLSAQSLSNKTEPETLVKLLRICAFI